MTDQTFSNQFYHKAAQLLTDDAPYNAVHVKRVHYFTRLMKQNPLFEQGANILMNDLYTIAEQPQALNAEDFSRLHKGRTLALADKKQSPELPPEKMDEARGRALSALVGFQLEMNDTDLTGKMIKEDLRDSTIRLSENILKANQGEKRTSISTVAARGALQKLQPVQN